MAGLFNALNAGRTSLEVSQKQIEISGNNIANVNTKGYSKQSAKLSPYPAMNFGGFFVGQGVKVTDVDRQHNTFISNQLVNKSVDYGYENSKTASFAEIERIFSVSKDNLAGDIDHFFDSWQELSTKPTDVVLRDITLQKGSVLAAKFNNSANELDQVQKNIGAQLKSGVSEVNNKLKQLGELNDRIYQIENNGQTANGARDSRESLLQELAQTIGAQSYELSSGMVNVQLPSGLPLVNGNSASTIETVQNGPTVGLKLHTTGATRELGTKSMGGEFAGLLDLQDEVIPALEDNLNQLAYSLITKVNELHQGGAGLDGSTGHLFFEEPPHTNDVPIDPATGPSKDNWQDAARAMKVSLSGAAQVAAAQKPTDGTSSKVGDNTNALKIADLSYALVVNGTDSFNSFYGKITSTIGIGSNQNKLNLKGAEDALVQVKNLRDSAAGVSLEEEMISLIQFQNSFQSSAKFLSTVDELMDTLLNMR
ncbi:flagellar hook-associated protein FlgK [Desulfotalea psychrophila]|uniref:Flagellar hook-associated protein 1 n=1 Tax=Desulfotalea psychrophila (strain LSv54 / DSM 12343) TaxID=177439 RepID=Q6AJR2_DESPS|nr:flagellar hook-associated protein FlgK [Desulfotalea psychrophila]CAG37418.1 related to Flagellar hook-associated protein 1 (FlgK) [Desulfotalea psychrophila LSv54]